MALMLPPLCFLYCFLIVLSWYEGSKGWEGGRVGGRGEGEPEVPRGTWHRGCDHVT